MSKCKKVKNPCKICLGTVTQKTGLQCQGACECWVHYSCLNYTPGKIKDIKAGIIKVTCPCPDCKSTLPKELRTDEPFSCSNFKCPANQPPRCENTACPINEDTPDKMNQTSAINAPPLAKCGTDCKTHPNATGVPGSPGDSNHHPVPMTYARRRTPSDSRLNSPKCPSGCSSATDVPGDYGQSPMDGLPSLKALEQMCNTVGQLTNQINCLMNKMKQVVEERSGGSGGGGCGGGGCGGGGGGGGGGCGGGGCGGGVGGNRRVCSQKGPKSMCPKPCYCPGNPGRRK